MRFGLLYVPSVVAPKTNGRETTIVPKELDKALRRRRKKEKAAPKREPPSRALGARQMATKSVLT